MRSVLSAAVASILVMFTNTSARAQSAGVFPVHGTNLTEGEAAAIGAVTATSYSALKKTRVLDPADTGPVLAQAGSAPDAARQLGLGEYIEVRAVRLETRITLEATLYNVHGSALYTTRATLMSLDDLEVVADRIAGSLYRRTPIEYTGTLDTVMGKETRAPNRMFAEKVIGVRLAAVAPFGAGVDVDPAIQLAFDARLEGTSYFLEIEGGFLIPSKFDDNRGGTLGGLVGRLGASYYLSNTSVSPYLGAGLSPRIMLGNYEGAGLTVNGRFGLMFMREHSSRIYVELGIDQNLLAFSKNSYDVYDSATGDYTTTRADDVLPTELSLAVGIGW